MEKPVKIDYTYTWFYKQYFRSKFDVLLRAQVGPSEEKKINPHFTHCCNSALLHKHRKTGKKCILLLIHFDKYFGFKFDLFLIVHIGPSREKTSIHTSTLWSKLCKSSKKNRF